MHKDNIADLLEENYRGLLLWLEEQDDDQWSCGPDNKWTTGQHALHLLQRIKPLNDALSMPRFLLRYAYGVTNRPLHDYDKIVECYHERLKENKEHSSNDPQKLKAPKRNDKRYLLTRLQVESKKLQYKTRRISDKNLDTLVLPHPLMGKMPIREILILNAYHVAHHTQILQEKY